MTQKLAYNSSNSRFSELGGLLLSFTILSVLPWVRIMVFCPTYSILGHLTYFGQLNVIITGFQLSYGRHKKEIKKREEKQVPYPLLLQITSLAVAASTHDTVPSEQLILHGCSSHCVPLILFPLPDSSSLKWYQHPRTASPCMLQHGPLNLSYTPCVSIPFIQIFLWVPLLVDSSHPWFSVLT